MFTRAWRSSWLLPLVFAAALSCTVSCSGPDHREQFTDYLEETLGPDAVELPSGLRIPAVTLNLGVEKAKYAPRVVLNHFSFLGYEYVLDPDVVEGDMRYLGDLVVGYAEHCGWDNNYHLYISLVNGADWSVTYDYEIQKLYLPDRYDLFKEMVTRFESTDFEEIASSEKGREFLSSCGLAELKHGKFEPTWEWTLCFAATKTVHLVRGEFTSHGS